MEGAMASSTRRSIVSGGIALAAAGPLAVTSAHAASRAELTARGLRALQKLEANEPRSRLFARNARAVLVFPSILKAGFVFGGETGNGVLLENGRAVGFYNLSGGSWGLQIGGQTFGFALFFMKDSALRYLEKSAGFSVGTGPSIVVVKSGAGAEVNSTTLSQDVYAFPFNQKGLMADLTLQGSKITRIHPD
jgi:lipid-binding SYLF domain-containing protein